jgi:hypothetical protein
MTTTTTPTPTTTTITTTTTEKPKPSVNIPSGYYWTENIDGFYFKISGSADNVTIKIRWDNGSFYHAPYYCLTATGVYNYDTEEIEFSGPFEYVSPSSKSEDREVLSANECGTIVIDEYVLWLTFGNSEFSFDFSGQTFKLIPDKYLSGDDITF